MISNAKGKPNFTEGPLFFRIILFTIPIMLTGFLQIAYNMADNIIVGKFSGDSLALAAVGSTGSLHSLVVNIVMGVAVGSGIVVSQFYGSGEYKRLSKCVHTSMLFSLIAGLVFGIIGFVISKPALVLLGTKEEVLPKAVLYFRIICCGIPANSVYNFGAAIMRGTGNSKVPLLILGSAGLCNVILNLVFVIGFGMTADGVALATIISQYLSAVAVVCVLRKDRDQPYALRISELHLDKFYLARILRFGLPAGIQSSMFSIANILMTAAFNTFPTTTVTANAIASNIDGITLTSMNSFGQAAVTFSGQNCGAKKPERIKKIITYCIIQSMLTGLIVAILELTFADPLISLYLDANAEGRDIVAATAKSIMTIMLTSYVIYGILDSASSCLKGLGYTVTSMMISLICICGIRMIWILGIFPRIGTLTSLILAYPISWVLASVTALVAFLIAFSKFKKSIKAERESIS